MVKGVTKRVVVVRPPSACFFEEAIFIVKDGVARSGATADQIVKEACRVADRYMAKQVKSKWPRFRLSGGIFMLFGAGITALAWFLSTILFAV